MKTALGPGTATIGLMLNDLLTFTSLGGALGLLPPGTSLSLVGYGKMFSYLLSQTTKLS